MSRRGSDLERLLASSGAALRRLAWLLTGESESASEILRDALVATYLAPGGETDTERARTAQRELVKAFVRDEGPVGAVEFGGGTSQRREWATTVLVHVLGWSPRSAGGAVGCSAEYVLAVAGVTAPDAALLRDIEPPPSVGRFDADEVIEASGPARARRRSRRRRLVALALVGVLVLVGVGLLGSQLKRPVGRATLVELPERFADVEVASGGTERLRLAVSGSTVDLRFYGKPATWARARVTAPTGVGDVVPGELRGMPFYVVRGRAVEATLVLGRTAADVRARSTTLVRAGRWTVIWPSQRELAETPARPLGLLWRTVGDRRAALLQPIGQAQDRMVLRGGGDGAAAVVLSDRRVLALVTEAGTRRTPVRDGHAVLTTDAGGVPLPYTAVGYGSVEDVRTRARLVVEATRDPDTSPLYALSAPREAWSDLPRRVPVTLRQGDGELRRITLVRGASR